MAKIERKSRDDTGRGDLSRSPRFRGERLEELFREELNSLLEIEISDPALEGARVTRVELSGDGSRARAWFTTPDADDNAKPAREAFERATGFIRSRLCDALPVKRVPDLVFRHDPAARLGDQEEEV